MPGAKRIDFVIKLRRQFFSKTGSIKWFSTKFLSSKPSRYGLQKGLDSFHAVHVVSFVFIGLRDNLAEHAG